MGYKHFFTLFLVSALLMTIYTCCGGCTSRFDTPRGISKHRNICRIFKHYEAAALQRRKGLTQATCKHGRNVPGKSQRKSSYTKPSVRYQSEPQLQNPSVIPIGSDIITFYAGFRNHTTRSYI
jgi:hypothetical protein